MRVKDKYVSHQCPACKEGIICERTDHGLYISDHQIEWTEASESEMQVTYKQDCPGSGLFIEDQREGEDASKQDD